MLLFEIGAIALGKEGSGLSPCLWQALGGPCHRTERTERREVLVATRCASANAPTHAIPTQSAAQGPSLRMVCDEEGGSETGDGENPVSWSRGTSSGNAW